MNSSAIRQAFIDFFTARGHTHMPPSSLVPLGDPSVLFTTAGMQQFKDYYSHPELIGSPRICTIQPSFRTSDIEAVGDDTHLTMFEMLGNFSFGWRTGEKEGDSSPTAYFKETAIRSAYEFVVNRLAINPNRIQVTVYQGDSTRGIPKDEQSAKIWRDLAINDINFVGDDNFWGPTGQEGPCGPATEIYVDGVEIWNLVFNEYYSSSAKQLTSLNYKGVDTGMGLERLAVVLQGKANIFATDLYASVITALETLSQPGKYSEPTARVIADHLKASMFLIADGVRPSNKAQGYILRRLIRRTALKARNLGLLDSDISQIIEQLYQLYATDYDRLATEYGLINLVISEEMTKFNRTLQIGLKELDRVKLANQSSKVIPTEATFKLFDTFGFPLELTAELAAKAGFGLDRAAFRERFKTHQQVSRAGLAKVFQGGLADNQPQTIKHHTAHHLLLAALRQVLGDHVHQRGSNVTSDRLRLDFSHPAKLTFDQLQEVERIVNAVIAAGLEVKREEMPKAEAEKLGALAEFGAKYGEIVSVYTIYNQDGSVFSRELCGGPHVQRTNELGHFTILKEEASSAGVRRIKAKVD